MNVEPEVHSELDDQVCDYVYNDEDYDEEIYDVVYSPAHSVVTTSVVDDSAPSVSRFSVVGRNQ